MITNILIIFSILLLFIYFNTSTKEHFLCKIENSVNNIFDKFKNKAKEKYFQYGPNAILNKFRDKTRYNLLKINKTAEKIILKI